VFIHRAWIAQINIESSSLNTIFSDAMFLISIHFQHILLFYCSLPDITSILDLVLNMIIPVLLYITVRFIYTQWIES
jgi:hypothetical protein